MPIHTMETGYKHISYFFGLVAVITFLGFYKKYFGLIPDFPGVGHIHHFHAVSLSLWLTILIIQPVLIIRKYLRLHRLIGKISYLLVPVMFVTMILVYHHQYLRLLSAKKPETESLAFVFSPMTDAIPFLIFYLLGIAHRHETAKHMRYMISTGIVIGGPGLGRVFMNLMSMDIFAAIGLMSLVTLLVFVSLILYDRVKGKKFTVNPFTIAFLIWLVPNILIIFFPGTSLWQSIAKWLVTTI
jgi:hypothetical protein